jgi:DNA-binding IclR family transcriptional regulator
VEGEVRREKTNYIIQSVFHALDVLEQFAGEHDELGVTDLSKRLKLHKNNVFRLLATLESRGYIEQNKTTENYRLGIRCLQLGRTYVSQMGLLRQAHAVIEGLARSGVRETAFLALFHKDVVVPIDAVEPDRPVRMIVSVGEPLPLHCTAAGKLHLASVPDPAARESLIEHLPRFTESTITDRQILLHELDRVSAQGFAVELGEHIDDVNSVAVPVRDYTRNVVGSLNVSGPAHRMTPERIENELVSLVVAAGQNLSSRLGFKDQA